MNFFVLTVKFSVTSGVSGHNFTMQGQPLSTTTEESDIGVKVTQNLKPSVQCQKSARTAQTVLAQLERAFHFSDRHIFVRH